MTDVLFSGSGRQPKSGRTGTGRQGGNLRKVNPPGEPRPVPERTSQPEAPRVVRRRPKKVAQPVPPTAPQVRLTRPGRTEGGISRIDRNTGTRPKKVLPRKVNPS